jgi:hypothetical protein
VRVAGHHDRHAVRQQLLFEPFEVGVAVRVS